MSIENDPAADADVPKALPTVIKFILPNAYHHEDQDHYVVTTFPKTYQDAIVEAVRLLGKYMFDPTPENTILKCSTRNRKGEWVWADIPPENWTQVMRQFGSNEVGVFEEKLSRALAKGFINGKVKLTAGKITGSQIQWSSEACKILPEIIRSKNYKEAVDFVKEMIKTNDTIIFFFFPNGSDTTSWIEFPHIAYTDDDIWRSIVPLPRSVLGVIATKNSETDSLVRSDGRG